MSNHEKFFRYIGIAVGLGLLLGALMGCASARPQTEGWQETPSTTNLTIIIEGDGNTVIVHVDQSGDVGGEATQSGDADATQTTDVDAEVEVPLLP